MKTSQPLLMLYGLYGYGGLKVVWPMAIAENRRYHKSARPLFNDVTARVFELLRKWN